MKKIILALIFINSITVANTNYELRLYEKVLPAIFKDIPIRIYVDKSSKALLENSDMFVIRKICDENVDLIIGKNFDNIPFICRDKPFFATSYRWYKNQENSLGAFYWRKGRPQIRFKKDIFAKYNLVLPHSLHKYAK